MIKALDSKLVPEFEPFEGIVVSITQNLNLTAQYWLVPGADLSVII